MAYINSIYLIRKKATDEALETPSNKEEEDEVPEVMVDVLGNPILPTSLPKNLRSQQDLVREMFTKAYSKFYFSC
jgi:uncharacterized protein YcgL (UPF0745 family)